MNKADPIKDERNQKILSILIDHYIRDGLPVSSKTIAEDSDFKMSSATIRHIMSDLEKAGFLHSPHTSAGRVPTAKGYRFFVDDLLNKRIINEFDLSAFAPILNNCIETKEIVSTTSSLLSRITKFASIIKLPQCKSVTLKQVEFLLLSEKRVLVILVLNQNEIQNRVMQTERLYTTSELKKAANYINKNFSGMELSCIRHKIIDAMQDDRRDIESIFELLLNASENAFDVSQKQRDNYVLSGEEHLLDLAEKDNIGHLRGLFAAFTQKEEILYLLDRCIAADGIKIYIGEESGYAALDSCSLVTAPYSVNEEIIGVLGVIGPTRMQYDQAIAAVDMTSKLLGKVLSGRSD